MKAKKSLGQVSDHRNVLENPVYLEEPKTAIAKEMVALRSQKMPSAEILPPGFKCCQSRKYRALPKC